MRTVQLIPIVVGSLGCVTKNIFKETKMFSKPLTRAPQHILIKSFFLAIG